MLLCSSLSWLRWPSEFWAGSTGGSPPPGGHSQPLGTASHSFLCWGTPRVRQNSRVFSGRREPCKKAHPLRAWIPVASRLFILKTPQELIFHAISAENSHGRTTIWRSGWWGRVFVQPGSAYRTPGCLFQVHWAHASLSSGIVGLRNEGKSRGERCPTGNAASSNLEKPEHTSWRSYIYLVQEPNMGH